MGVRDHDLVDVGKRQPGFTHRGLDPIGRIVEQHARIDDGHRVVDEDPAVHRPHREWQGKLSEPYPLRHSVLDQRRHRVGHD